MFTPSPQQHDYYDWIDTGSGSAILEAVAGAGKTTTLVEGLVRMRGTKFFGAYNKKIADEIAAKVLRNDETRVNEGGVAVEGLTVATMHSAGFRAWLRAARGVKVNENKCRDIFREAAERFPEYGPFEQPVLRLVSYAKQSGVGLVHPENSRSTWSLLIDHFDVEIPNPDDGTLPPISGSPFISAAEVETLVIKLARKTLQQSVALDNVIIDFDDMIYAPLIHRIKLPQFDWVLIDEAQDTNVVRRLLALGMLKGDGRLVGVGDRHQAIYGFTGADADALDLLGAARKAILLPLTITYRCPKAVVAHAHQWVKHIQAAETAPEGKVTNITIKDLPKTAKPGDAVLCRFTAPLIANAFAFIAANIPAKVEGGDIGKGLIDLARRWKVKSLERLEDQLEKFLQRETAKYRLREQEGKAVAVEDKVGCLRVIIARVRQTAKEPTVDVLCSEITNLFGDSNGNMKEVVLFSTIHKSKGREWSRVFWLTTGPSKFARKDWEMQQENNLCYVATTRAMSELFLVPTTRGDQA